MRINILYVVRNDNTDMRIHMTAPPKPTSDFQSIRIRFQIFICE
jgi:hypothetical protein